jgi:hypothetical protein
MNGSERVISVSLLPAAYSLLPANIIAEDIIFYITFAG